MLHVQSDHKGHFHNPGNLAIHKPGLLMNQLLNTLLFDGIRMGFSCFQHTFYYNVAVCRMVIVKVFDKSRPMVGAQAVGVARGAYEAAIKYSKEREQFGKPICSFQAVQFMLADMATQIEAARALVMQTAHMVDSGAKNYSKESAMCKYFASDVAMKVTTDAVQILGGYGYMKEYPVEKMMRDAKVLQIYEGTNQIQRSIVAANILKEF